MTKQTMAETILLRVNGGSLSHDSNVLLADILAYLPVAYADVVRKVLFENRAMQRADAGVSVYSADVNQSLYHTMTVTPALHSTRGIYYADLPHVLLDLPGAWAMGYAQPIAAHDSPYAKIANPSMIAGDPLLGKITPYVWWETMTNDAGDQVSRIYFSTMLMPICDVLVAAIVGIENFGETDHIPGGKTVDAQIIDRCVQHFLGQRSVPTPGINNEADSNDNNTR